MPWEVPHNTVSAIYIKPSLHSSVDCIFLKSFVFQAWIMASHRPHATFQSSAGLGERPVRRLRSARQGLHAHVPQQWREHDHQCQPLRCCLPRGAEQAEDQTHRRESHSRSSQSVSFFVTWLIPFYKSSYFSSNQTKNLYINSNIYFYALFPNIINTLFIIFVPFVLYFKVSCLLLVIVSFLLWFLLPKSHIEAEH